MLYNKEKFINNKNDRIANRSVNIKNSIKSLPEWTMIIDNYTLKTKLKISEENSFENYFF